MCSILGHKKAIKLFFRRLYVRANIDREHRSLQEAVDQDRITKRVWISILAIPAFYYMFVFLVADPWMTEQPSLFVPVAEPQFHNEPTASEPSPLRSYHGRRVRYTTATPPHNSSTCNQHLDYYDIDAGLRFHRLRMRRLHDAKRNPFTPVFSTPKEATTTTSVTTPTTDAGTLLLPVCFVHQNFTVKLILNPTDFLAKENRSMESVYPRVFNGGYYRPRVCQSRHKVAILVPIYRNRTENLHTFLLNIHTLLINQRIEYRIFVIEQRGNPRLEFNKGRLLNAGFKEMQKFGEWRCVVFHDVNLLPLSSKILYTCPNYPRHMSTTIINRNESLVNGTQESLFGGVTAMTLVHFHRVNGYSNMYWGGWGEDRDMYLRLQVADLASVRYSKSIAKYHMLPHYDDPVNPHRLLSLVTAKDRAHHEGLNSVEYTVVSFSSKHLYTHIGVDIDPKNYETIFLNNSP